MGDFQIYISVLLKQTESRSKFKAKIKVSFGDIYLLRLDGIYLVFHRLTIRKHRLRRKPKQAVESLKGNNENI